MEPNLFLSIQFSNLVFLALLFLSHLLRSEKRSYSNILLSGALFTITYSAGVLLLIDSQLVLRFPHFYRTANICMYLSYPLGYLYVVRTLNQKRWQRWDWLHFIPALVYSIDYLPFFLLPAEVKRSIIQGDIDGKSLYLYNQGWILPDGFHFVFRTLLFSSYCLGAFFKIGAAFYSNTTFRKENKGLLGWLLVWTSFLSPNSLPFLLFLVANMPFDLASLANTLASASILLFSIYLFMRPDILYGLRGLWVDAAKEENRSTRLVIAAEAPLPEKVAREFAAAATGSNGVNGMCPEQTTMAITTLQVSNLDLGLPVEKEKKKVYLKEETVEKIADLINAFIDNERPFLQKRFSISDLSAAVKVPAHQLSAYLNNYLGVSFSDFVNEKRINYLLQQVDQNPAWAMYTLEALALQVGFNNRYTFLNAFKKFTGKTPSEYFRGRKVASR